MKTSGSLKHCILLNLLIGTSVSLFAQSSAPTGGGNSLDLKGMDTSVKACQDFYQFANGNWLVANPVPADRNSYGTGAMLNDRNLELLHQILEDAAKDRNAAKGSPARLVGDFYRSGMDEARIEADGAKPLTSELGRIQAIRDGASLQDEIARLHTYNISPVFAFSVLQDFKNSSRQIAWIYQAGLGLPDRDYYFKDDEKTKELRKGYLAHVARMFELLGDKPDQAAAEAATVMTIEMRLAKASMTAVEQRDPSAIYHMMKVADLDALTPDFSWSQYFAAVGLKQPSDINVGQPDFVKEVGAIMKSVSLDDWKTYLRWHLIHSQAARLNSAFVDENFRFFGTAIGGAKVLRPRWKRVEQDTDNLMGEALGQLFVARAFTPEAKARALAMVMNLKAALKDRINALDWISEATRRQALTKVDAITVKIGYPDKWRDYSSLRIDSPSYVANAMEADAFEFQRTLKKQGKPVDRTEWGMTPATVDAYYNGSMNEIVFPAGILQPPFFDPKADDAVIYGSIGAIIGHELTHGFDDQGRQFDDEGNMKNWWTAEDEKNYNARAAIIEKQFDEYIGVDAIHVNGKLTLGENIADLGGLKIAYLAFQKAMEGKPRPVIDGYTPEQRFFISFAQAWRRNTRPEAVRLMLATDPHSPPRFRLMGPVSNMPEFFSAFHCKPGDPMVRAEAVQVKIW